MKIIIFFLLLRLLFALSDLPLYSAQLSTILQNRCITLVQTQKPHSEIPRAFLCGKNLSQGEDQQIFIRLSLYHLLVVSGSHLCSVLLLFELFGQSFSRASILGMLGFVFWTGLQAPILRAFAAWIWTGISNKIKLSLSANQVVLFSGLTCLAFNPELIKSSSLQLSWAASLSLVFVRVLRSREHPQDQKQFILPLQKHILIFFLLIPFLTGWGQLNPLGILSNLILGPLLEVVLWPISLLWLFDDQWGSMMTLQLMRILSFLAQATPVMALNFELGCGFRWLILAGLQALLHFWERQNKCAITA